MLKKLFEICVSLVTTWTAGAPNTINWGDLAFPGHGKENLSPQEKKVRKLQKELDDTQIDCDILKIALVIFTEKP